MHHLTEAQWIAIAAHRLQYRWRSINPGQLDDLAADLWQDEELRTAHTRTGEGRRQVADSHLDRRPGEASLNAMDAEAWMARCARRLLALDPNSPLDGTDWDDVASDLLEAVLRDNGFRDGEFSSGRPWLSPEFAAESYMSMQ